MSKPAKRKYTVVLFALALGMFGFAFAMVPLYNVFCELTGLNGKTSAQAALLDEIDGAVAPAERQVTVEFVAQVGRGMPLEFRPSERKLVVRPGQMTSTTYFVRNRSREAVTGQAVPSVAPGRAAQYLKKMDCFCFEQQQLPAGGEMEMGVRFLIATELPANIRQLTLSYTMFQVGEVEQIAGHQGPDRTTGL